VALLELVPERLRERGEAHRLADRLGGVIGCPRQRGRDRPVEPRRPDEVAVGGCAQREAHRDGDRRGEQVAEVCALAAELRGVRASQLRERAGVRRHASRIVTTPADPSTRTGWPVRISAVARPVPTTAGRPYSRQTIAACDMTPPMSVTTALT